MLKSLSLRPYRATTHKPETQHSNMFATHAKNTHTHTHTNVIEMHESLFLGPCRARKQLQNTTMSSDIEFTHLTKMPKIAVALAGSSNIAIAIRPSAHLSISGWHD